MVRYGEGLFIGCRHYHAQEIPVLFSFGYGLSYTTFACSNPQVSATTFNDVETLILSVAVANTGSIVGRRLYSFTFTATKPGWRVPLKNWKAFAWVSLQIGQTQTFTTGLDFRARDFYQPGHNRRWISEDGQFDVLMGASATDIRCIHTAAPQSTPGLPGLLDEESAVREWLAGCCGKVVFDPVFRQTVAQTQQATGGAIEQSDTFGLDMVGFLGYALASPAFLRSPVVIHYPPKKW